MTTNAQSTGAEAYRWNLDCFYQGVDDPKIDADLKAYEAAAIAFRAAYKGNLHAKLGSAIKDYAELDALSNKVAVYLFLRLSTNTKDDAAESKMAIAQNELSRIGGEELTFFALEIIALSDDAITTQAASDTTVRTHLPWIERIRRDKPHVFDEAIESALSKRSPYGPGAWSEFHDKFESLLRFTWEDQERTLTDMLHLLTEDGDPERRAQILKTINDGFKGTWAEYCAQALYVTAGAKSIEDRERHYGHPMAAANSANDIPDATVEALHAAVREVGAPLAQRYYRLKTELLGLPRLRWSDRNAKLRFEDASLVPFEEARRITVDSFRKFSPTLAGIVEGFFQNGRVDAPGVPNRRGGAFNYSIMLPGQVPETFVFMNYQGSARDVATLAHECGHGAHGILAAQAQGALMLHAPMAYAETASIFGERMAFEYLKADLETKGDKKSLMALVISAIDDMMNTVVRQISFSEFERRLHAAGGRKLSVAELNAIWCDVTTQFYGPDGETFVYNDMDLMWTYIGHFHRPFYVYSYAFAKLFVDGIYSCKDTFGEKFEPMYLEILRAGGTKSAKELVAPLGLDPENPAFWADGIRSSFVPLIELAERLAAELGLRKA
ncbi:MAG: M3 family metallopeptidase [Patescibacteria group bacterium]|jgi:oligoendopeptidase F